MIFRSLISIGGVALLAAASWLASSADWAHHGATLEPSHLTLGPGEHRVVRLVNNEYDVVALRFSLRFDESVIVLEAIEPENGSILTGGNAINFPARHAPGMVEVPGSAVTGGRVFAPFKPVYRITLRGVRPGKTTLEVEDLSVVDVGNVPRSFHVSPSTVTVNSR